MELLAGRPTVNVEGDRNHLRFFAELSHNACVAILNEGAHRFRGVHDFEGIQRRGQSSQDLRLGHWQINRSELH